MTTDGVHTAAVATPPPRPPGRLAAVPYVLHLLAQVLAATALGLHQVQRGRQFFTLNWALVGVAAYIVLVVATVWVARRVGPPRRVLGLVGVPVGRAVRLAAAAYVVVLVANGLLEPLLHGAADQGLKPTRFPGGATAGAAVAVSAVTVCVLAPFAEELFFRGLVHGSLRRFGARVAVPASAAIFAAVHFVPTAFPVLFVVGVLLALLYERTGSLVPGMLLHLLVNTSAFVLGLAV